MTSRRTVTCVCRFCQMACTTHSKEKLTTRLPFTTALAVACRDIDVRNVKALIMGPHETPYEFGFFEVCRERCIYPCLCKDGLIQLDSLPFGSTKVEPPLVL